MKTTLLNNRSKCLISGIFVIMICSVVFIPYLQSQSYTILNPADRRHPWVSEVNPAVISLQNARISLGHKIFQLGFLPKESFGLKESHINASFPFYLPFELGIGCDVHYYSAGMYSELIGSVQLSRKIYENISFGFKLGFIKQGFTKTDFTLVDQNDPLLTGNLGKSSLNFGFGGYWNPGHWALGLGVDHVNHPNMGVKSQANLPMEIYGAAGYKLGKFMPSFLIKKNDLEFRYGIGLSITNNRLGALTISYQNNMPIKMEARLNLSRNSRLQYGFDVPSTDLSTVSMGSHEAIFSYIFDRAPDIGQPEIFISTNTLNIVEKKVIRSIPADLSIFELKNMNDLAPVYLDTKVRNQNILIISTGALNEYETKTMRNRRYDRFARQILKTIRDNPDVKLILNADNGSFADARVLRDYLIEEQIVHSQKISIAKVNASGKVELVGFKPGRLTVIKKAPTLSEEKLLIRFIVPGKTRRLRDWKLTVSDNQNHIVKNFQGKDELIDQLEWDWINENGKLVPPGQYTCFLKIHAMSGKEKHAFSAPLKVIHVKRTVAFRFSREAERHASKIDN